MARSTASSPTPPPPRLFGTDGIRGPAGRGLLAPVQVTRLGLALARVLVEGAPSSRRPRVLVGRDTRVSGPQIQAALTAGLLAGGVAVDDGGVLPTPGVALLTRSGDYSLGVVVSASHNPWQDNGVKFLGADGAKLDDAFERAVEGAFARPGADEVDPDGIAQPGVRPDAADRYSDALVRSFRGLSLRGRHVVVDAANGAQSGIARPVLRRLGARVTVLNDAPDGRNINRSCGALHPRKLQRTVRELGADLGVAFDGDADRLQVCDEAGKLLDGDYVLAALAPRLKQARRLKDRTVVGTSMTNGSLGAYLRERGMTLVRTPVGDRHIVAEMVAHGFGLGGEPSGHLIVPRGGLLTGDALYVALALLRILRDERIPASALAPGYAPWPAKLVSMQVRERTPLEALPATSAAIRAAEEALGTEGRIVVRYSGTEPKVRVLVEARRRSLLRRALEPVERSLAEEVGE